MYCEEPILNVWYLKGVQEDYDGNWEYPDYHFGFAFYVAGKSKLVFQTENHYITLGVDGISDWSIPTKDQIDAFYAAKDDITPAPDRQRYLWQDGTTMKQRYMSDGSDSNANFNYAIFLRPVATVSITKD